MKLYLTILLIIIIFILLICHTIQENFYNMGQSQKAQLEMELQKNLELYNINEYQHKIKKHTEIQNLKHQTAYSLSQDKVLISLFYDSREKHSREVYDNTLPDSELSHNLWNMIKHHHLSENPPLYLNPKLVHLEEISCFRKEMEKCVEQEARQVRTDVSGAPSLFLTPPPRNSELVNKLPLIMVSFQKLTGSKGKELVQIIYDGIYQPNNINYPLGYDSFLEFLQKKLDAELEIKTTHQGKKLSTVEEKTNYYTKYTGDIIETFTSAPEPAPAPETDPEPAPAPEPAPHPIEESEFKISSQMTKPLYLDYHIVKSSEYPHYIKI